MDPKKPWYSKTVWVNLVMALVAFVPGAEDWVAHNPQAAVVVGVVVNLFLRAITKQPVSLQ